MARLLHISASSDFAQYVDRILPALVAAGHEVHFISARGPEPERLLGSRGVKIHSVPIERSIAPGSDLRALASLSRLILSLRPDLVHAHTPKGGLLGMLAARALNIPARIYQMHGLRYETTRGIQRKLLMNSERLAVRAAQQVICVSPSVRARAVNDRILPPEKSLVLGSGSAQGIELSQFEPDSWSEAALDLAQNLGIPRAAPCVVYMGRLAADKGLADLGAAWHYVSTARPEAHLILAGNVDATDPVDLTALRSQPGVHLLPYQEEPRPLLALASVITLPSYREGLPQTILEAGAMTKPVVATRVTGIVDALLPGKSGLLVKPHAPQDLAKALVALLADENLRKRMGKAGRTHVRQHFSPEPIISETMALYESALGQKRSD